MKIIKFSCHQCNERREKYYPDITFDTLNQAIAHINETFPEQHEVFIMENEEELSDD